MKIKICHLTSVHERYDIRIFQKICTSLAYLEYDVYLIVADGKGNELKNNINIIDVGHVKSRLNRILVTSRKILRKAFELDCSLYQFHDPELFPVALKLKRKGKKVIFDSHEYLPGLILDKEYIPKIIRKLSAYLVQKYYEINVKKIDAVFSVTPHIVNYFNAISNKVFLLTNYPIVKGIPKFTQEEYLARENTVFYAGTIYKYSQQDIIIKAIERINNISYSLVGNVDDEYKNKISKLPSWGKVNFSSFVPKSDLDNMAKNVTIGLAIFDYIPNLGKKWGSLGVNKIFEYMLYGLPIICTDFILWKEIIQNHNCGICVNPNDEKEIYEAINYLKMNKKEAYQMGQNGRSAVINYYNWGIQEKNLFKIYDILLK